MLAVLAAFVDIYNLTVMMFNQELPLKCNVVLWGLVVMVKTDSWLPVPWLQYKTGLYTLF